MTHRESERERRPLRIYLPLDLSDRVAAITLESLPVEVQISCVAGRMPGWCLVEHLILRHLGTGGGLVGLDLSPRPARQLPDAVADVLAEARARGRTTASVLGHEDLLGRMVAAGLALPRSVRDLVELTAAGRDWVDSHIGLWLDLDRDVAAALLRYSSGSERAGDADLLEYAGAAVIEGGEVLLTEAGYHASRRLAPDGGRGEQRSSRYTDAWLTQEAIDLLADAALRQSRLRGRSVSRAEVISDLLDYKP